MIRESLRNRLATYAYFALFVAGLAAVQMLFYYFIGGTGRPKGIAGCCIAAAAWAAIPALIARRWAVYTAFASFTLLFYGNLIYYRYYGALISWPIIKSNISMLPSLGDSIVTGMVWSDAALFIPLAAFAAADAFFFRRKRPGRRPMIKAVAIAAAMALTVVAAYALLRRQKTLKEMGDHYYFTKVAMTRYFGYFTYLLYDITHNSGDIKLSAGQLSGIETFLSGVAPRPAPVGPGAACGGKNVILILVESLESFPVGLTVEGKKVMPFLDSLTNSGNAFYAPCVINQTGIGRSADGQLILNTGLLPLTDIAAANLENRKYPSLASLLKQSGKWGDCVAMHTFAADFWNQANFSKMLGYDMTYDRSSFKHDEIIRPTLGDSSFMAQSVHILSSLRKPFLAQVITASSHNAIDLGDRKRISAPPAYGKVLGRYLEVINYVDGALESFFSKLDAAGLLESSVVLITGDHTFSFIEDDDKVPGGRYVPLIIYNSCRDGRFDEPMGQVDIFPTMVDALDICYGWRGLGSSVFSDAPPCGAMAQQGKFTGAGPDCKKRLEQAWRISELIIKGNALEYSAASVIRPEKDK